MPIGFVFKRNRTQPVRLPAEAKFPESVKKILVKTFGKDRIISSMGNTWDSFSLSEENVSNDFMTERAQQTQSERGSF